MNFVKEASGILFFNINKLYWIGFIPGSTDSGVYVDAKLQSHEECLIILMIIKIVNYHLVN